MQFQIVEDQSKTNHTTSKDKLVIAEVWGFDHLHVLQSLFVVFTLLGPAASLGLAQELLHGPFIF